MRRWLRQFVRSKTNPIQNNYALDAKHKLSGIYVFAAYNAMGIFLAILLFQYYPMTKKEKKQPGRYYARLFRGDNVTVYRLDGLNFTETYNIPNGSKSNPNDSDLEAKETTTDDSEMLTD